MMGGRILLGVTLAAIVGRPASADPIQYQATFFDLNGIPRDSLVDLPDLEKGGSVSLPGGNIYQAHGEATYPTPTQPLNGDFSFQILVKDPAAHGFDGSALNVSGDYHGTLTGPTGVPARFGGGLEGQATSVSDGSYPMSTAIPEAFLELMKHPDRINIRGEINAVGIGEPNETILNQTLTIDPAPVPEPSTLVTLLVAGCGLVAYRRRRNTR